ncbi:PREDICTED: lysophospholipid acyltransferase 7 [Nicrophorus vespilloides]|uniref:Lysophospholipid acyltransferase 7 n=1 Tax=Nicrophorus vespilloides TaxID=110193 RepID=A0ABM1NFE9_NICVS|nr:PREDICTED: lysophospholipid acyltransferase 7 [Nicrophorus vespilloides]
MDLEDIVYLVLLFASIVFGLVYREIEDQRTKKLVGTVVGLFVTFMVSGFHIVHSFITVFINSLIILHLDKRKCHLISFAFSFLYLLFFRTTEYFGIPYPPDHTNLIQMMLTLKMVGLALELNNGEDDIKEDTLTIEEIFHYSFNYIGVLTGPYIRYKTFRDYFEKSSFAKLADWKQITLQKIKFIPLYAILFLAASSTWPLSYAKTDEFYEERSLLYRFWYIWPNFFTFRMRLYIGLVLSECVCTVAGFGAYPEFAEPKPAHGPSKELKRLDEMTEKEQKEIGYSFETIHNVNPYGAEFCPTFRESMKHWNMCIQYWLAVNVYKRFPSKRYRTFVTMFVSAVWHGVYTGYYVCLCGAPFVLPIEDVYVKLVLKGRTGKTLYWCEWFMVVFKMFFFSYLSIAFHLLSLDWVMHYYNSIYHIGLIISVLLYVAGIALLKLRKRRTTSPTAAVRSPNKDADDNERKTTTMTDNGIKTD